MGIIIHRTPQQIQSEINLTKANIKQVENGLHYSPKDQEILIPHYKKLLQKLSLELSKIHNDINEIEVIDEEVVDGYKTNNP